MAFFPSSKVAALTLLAGLGLASAPGHAAAPAAAVVPFPGAHASPRLHPVANWRNPYGNVDPRNDVGNDTGNAATEQLNAGQLDRNYRGPWYYRGQPAPRAAYGVPPGYAPYAPPPPAYYPPTGGYYAPY